MTDQIITTRAELKKLIRDAVREEFEDAGLRVEDAEQRDKAREDFRFLRKLRTSVEGAANKIGMTIVLALVGGTITATWAGVRYLLRQ